MEQKKQGNSLVEAHINLGLDRIVSHHCGYSGELDSFPFGSPTRDKLLKVAIWKTQRWSYSEFRRSNEDNPIYSLSSFLMPQILYLNTARETY